MPRRLIITPHASLGRCQPAQLAEEEEAAIVPLPCGADQARVEERSRAGTHSEDKLVFFYSPAKLRGLECWVMLWSYAYSLFSEAAECCASLTYFLLCKIDFVFSRANRCTGSLFMVPYNLLSRQLLQWELKRNTFALLYKGTLVE